MPTTLLPLLALLSATPLPADAGEVLGQVRIEGLPGQDDQSRFGQAVGALGDLDGNGVTDLIVGAVFDDTGGFDRGAAFVLFLEADGSVSSSVKLSASTPGLALDDYDYFGDAAAGIGDVNGDGVPDAAVAATGDDDGLSGPSSNSVGALWILFLNVDGTVAGTQKISATQGGLAGPVEQYDRWFADVAGIGDLDGDGVPDLAVGVAQDDDGANAAGAVQILFLNADGTVKAQTKISATAGGFGGTLEAADLFGSAVASVGDLDGNGVADLAVGAPGDDDGKVGTFASRGAVWILFLDAAGSVIAETKVSDLAGGFEGVLADDDGFGGELAGLGDVDGDGVPDLAVGATSDNGADPSNPWADSGAVWILMLETDGTVRDARKIAEGSGGLAPDSLDLGDFFGSVAPLGDVDGDGAVDLAVGASGADDAGSNAGSLFVLFLADAEFGEPYGCGTNPPGSLVDVAGTPKLGDTWTVGLLDPADVQPAGSLGFLVISLAPDANLPCGTLLPGFGLGSAALPGALLVDPSAPARIALLGPASYGGAALPATFAVPIPATAALDGLPLFVQGTLFDPSTAFGLTEARAITLGG